MKAKDYLSQLSLEARWRLPPEEAADLVAEYTDMLSQDTRPEEALRRDFGSPRQAVRLVCPPRAYGQWLAVFGILAVCLVLPVLWAMFSWRINFYRPAVAVQFGLGLLLSLVWFRRQGEKKPGRLPGMLTALLGVLLAGAAAAGGVLWYLSDTVLNRIPPGWIGRLALLTLTSLGLLSAALGLIGLVRARLEDRRWRALYVLGLTLAAVSVFTVAQLGNMSIDVAPEGLRYWWMRYMVNPILITGAVGLAGTGVALC